METIDCWDFVSPLSGEMAIEFSLVYQMVNLTEKGIKMFFL